MRDVAPEERLEGMTRKPRDGGTDRAQRCVAGGAAAGGDLLLNAAAAGSFYKAEAGKQSYVAYRRRAARVLLPIHDKQPAACRERKGIIIFAGSSSLAGLELRVPQRGRVGG